MYYYASFRYQIFQKRIFMPKFLSDTLLRFSKTTLAYLPNVTIYYDGIKIGGVNLRVSSLNPMNIFYGARRVGCWVTGDTLTLQYVKPTKVILCKSFGCEQKAAAIRNKTIDSMINKDVSDVAYRFLQSREGAESTILEAAQCSLLAMISPVLLPFMPTDHRSARITSILLVTTVLYVDAALNFRNSIRYKATEDACESWLGEQLGESQLAKLKKLNFNTTGLLSLKSFLAEAKIDASSVEKQISERQEHTHSLR
jgi:hypothetical protein